MRTKALLAAAVLAAGLATSMAETYSQNIVGYVNQVYPNGYSIAVNPLKTTNNTIVSVIPTAPAFTVVYTYNGGSGFAPGNTYNPYAGGWGNPAQVLGQGQGYFIQNTSGSSFTNTYVGEVVLQNTNTLANGYNLVGSAVPVAGAIDTVLQLVPGAFDVVYAYNNGVGYLPGNTYNPYAGGWGGGAPVLSVGQGIFYQNNNAANAWVQNFTIP